MTLLITLFAAIGASLLWYKDPSGKMRYGMLALMYWGAAIMWFVDAAAEYIKNGADYFVPSYADMVNDAFLGVSVVALGLLIWMIYLFIKDPEGKIKSFLKILNILL